ncbi:hypothetical protein Q8G37_15895 [Bacillus wiedmannii]|uniref:hypothetical protein n=1 Tax=Bacillus wiedmannii TaxID=1890302 RepID=UPI0027318084|nr:hypothetical protein [Bacillus wiedmannii]MDP1457929.1 hypothetical protein [Bacillus wiedmannii]
MAKLDGIKLVSESTVEYNGFVYELVGQFDEETEIGNLLKCTYSYSDFTVGAFYKVIHDSKKAVIDNVGDNPIIGSSKFDVFRKSHAITPDKLTDAEGVVKIELPDGTKLEGTPSDLEKITRSMQAFQSEQVATVEMPEEAVEVEEAGEPVAERLQVGDYAKVIQQGHENFGYITKITNDNRDSHLYPFATELLNGKSGDIHSEDQLLKATDEEVLEAKQSLLKEGDFARVVGVENTEEACGPHDFETGTIVNLYSFDSDDNTFETRYLNGDTPDAEWVHRKNLEPLTKEETEHIAREAEEEKKAKAEREEQEAERLKWAVIGREVGEIKKGDIVRTVSRDGSVNPEGTIGIAEYDGSVGSTATIVLNGNRGNYSRVELIVPVEQRFDTVG